MIIMEEVSSEDFDEIVLAVSDVVSRFYPGCGLRAVERTFQAWKSEPFLICDIEADPGARMMWRGVAAESAGPEKARERVLKDMFAGVWPQAFSGDEMRLRLSLLPENELRKLSRRCAVPGLSMLRTAPAV